MQNRQEMILIKNGELALKGLNRGHFEDVLMHNLKLSLRGLGTFEIKKSQSTIFIRPNQDDVDLDEACDRVSRVFGISAYTRALMVEKDMDAIKAAAPDYVREWLMDAKTFKVEARRADKQFLYTSPQIGAELGGALLAAFPHLKVDVHNPDITVWVEIRDFGAYIHAAQLPGAGGLPVGTGGKAALLISGGIDSPVAAYMMAKRGIELTCVHFASPPYTSERAEQKVISLLKQVARYAGPISLCIVPFTEIQEQIRDNSPEEMFTVTMRRVMMRIAERIARNEDCGALVTGESVAQVASQTIPALMCTEAVTTLPVFRPVIGMDKEEIIQIARKIETFEISILPYEDCCTVFTPKHPRTRPTVEMAEKAERNLPIEEMVQQALTNLRWLNVR